MNPLFPHIKPKEKEITQEIRSYLRFRGIFHWKVHQGLGSTPGISDILGCFRGRMLAIEVKAGYGTLSDKQRDFLNRVKEEGGIAFVARSVDDVIKEIG